MCGTKLKFLMNNEFMVVYGKLFLFNFALQWKMSSVFFHNFLMFNRLQSTADLH